MMYSFIIYTSILTCTCMLYLLAHYLYFSPLLSKNYKLLVSWNNFWLCIFPKLHLKNEKEMAIYICIVVYNIFYYYNTNIFNKIKTLEITNCPAFFTIRTRPICILWYITMANKIMWVQATNVEHEIFKISVPI